MIDKISRISRLINNKSIHNFLAYLGASLIMMILNLAINPWIAKNMSPEDYAITGYYSSFSSLIGPIIAFYLIHFYIKEFFKLDNPARKRLFSAIAKALVWFSAIVSVLCFLGILGYILIFTNNFSLPISPYLALSVFALPLTGLLNLQLAQYKMEKSPKPYFFLSLGNGLLGVFLTLLLVVFLKLGALGKLSATLLCNFLVFLFLLWKCKDLMKLKTEFSNYRKIFKFCLPLALSAMLGYFTNGFSTTYLESLGNNYEYGFYVVGVSIGAYLSTFSSALYNTFQPDLYESIVKKDWKKYTKFAFLLLGSIGIVVLIFILLAPFIISILTAGRYVGATIYAQIIALSTFTSTIYFIINDFSIATDHPQIYLYTTILGSVGIVVAMPVMANSLGYIGGCWVMVGSYILFALISIILLCITTFLKNKRHYHK